MNLVLMVIVATAFFKFSLPRINSTDPPREDLIQEVFIILWD